uniref:SET domain-containing protein n=2 Tax=Caenorhabditis japonica TaxID=281687 RepID=A0A8R1E528_CAEJA
MGQGSGDDGVPPTPFSTAAGHSPAHSSSSSATSSTSTPTPQPPPPTSSGVTRITETSWKQSSDESLAEVCIFHVPDKVVALPNSKRAECSLPMNLLLKSTSKNRKKSIWSSDHIPRGVRFGPLVGEIRLVDVDSALICPAEASMAGGTTSQEEVPFDEVPDEWKVFSPSGARLTKTICVKEDGRSNWMKYVTAADEEEGQNLVAAQVGSDIYFYTVKKIEANTELAFWFSRDYARKLNYSATPYVRVRAPPAVVEAAPALPSALPSAIPSALPEATAASETPMAIDYSVKKLVEPAEESTDASSASDEEMIDVEEKEKSRSKCTAFSRPNVIQNPVVRPVPTRLTSFSASLDPLAVYKDYFLRNLQSSELLI